MPNVPASATSSSVSLKKLRVDFYESGIGDTIIVTFPDGGIGIVDAHPSSETTRPAIEDLIRGKKVHFVCLTHPHADHGVDLISILEKHTPIDAFWHTTSDISAFLFRVQETQNFPSEVRDFATRLNQDWANFLIDIFFAVADRGIPEHVLRADIESINYAGVDVHVLAPEEAIQNRFKKVLQEKIATPERKLPDTNLLSAVLALHFGSQIVLLGADALQANWSEAYRRWYKKKLPKACILKVPHHGAANSVHFRHSSAEHTYFDMCHRTPPVQAVLFAGDRKHPHPKVYEKLNARAQLHCLSNGLVTAEANPLNLKLPGARAVLRAKICQPVVSFELDEKGTVAKLMGHSCKACPILATTATVKNCTP